MQQVRTFKFLITSEYEKRKEDDPERILHIPTGSVMEINDAYKPHRVPPEKRHHTFQFVNRYGGVQEFDLTILTSNDDNIMQILDECAEWYCHYCVWLDRDIRRVIGPEPVVQLGN